MRRPAILAAAAAFCAALSLSPPAARAAQEVLPGRLDPRSGTLTYRPGDVYNIDCTMLSTVTIILGPEEDAEKGGTLNGDPNAYEWESGGNMLVLKCISEVRAQLNRTTILSAHTVHGKTRERRSYAFAVRTRPLAHDAKNGVAVVTFQYPSEEAQRRAEAAKERAEQEAAARGASVLDVAHYYGRRNREYKKQAETGSAGDRLAQGVRASDNGNSTVFEFRGNHPGAAIMFIDDTGQEMTMGAAPRDGGAVVLPRVAKSRALDPQTKERWVFRLGDAVFCLWNFDPAQPVGGYNPGTGTASPDVVIRPRRRPLRPQTTTAPAEAPVS